jgi:hypothetical protein
VTARIGRRLYVERVNTKYVVADPPGW